MGKPLPGQATLLRMRLQTARVSPARECLYLHFPQPPVSRYFHVCAEDVLAGNIGSCKKMKYGCMGDPVNLASRLEGIDAHMCIPYLTTDGSLVSQFWSDLFSPDINAASSTGLAKHYGVGTLCSDATRAKLPPHFLCRKLDLVKVKGKEEAVWVYDTRKLQASLWWKRREIMARRVWNTES